MYTVQKSLWSYLSIYADKYIMVLGEGNQIFEVWIYKASHWFTLEAWFNLILWC